MNGWQGIVELKNGKKFNNARDAKKEKEYPEKLEMPEL